MSLNFQPIEKVIASKADPFVLSVHSIFRTLQGEGPYSGLPSIFIRLAGCNLQCPMCDTDYTSGRQTMHVDDIAKKAVAIGSDVRLAVITGGEPFRQPLQELFNSLVREGYRVQVETNGTVGAPYLLSSSLLTREPTLTPGVCVVCSPKTGVVHMSIHMAAMAYKYVLDAGSVDPEDGLPIRALGHVANPRLARPPRINRRPIYLQPADHKRPEENRKNAEAVAQSCLRFGYRAQVQLHKYLGLE